MKEMKLIEEILSEMNNVSKSQKKFIIILMKTIISTYGKINFSSLSRYSGCVEKTFRRWFQKAFDFSAFNSKAIDKVIISSNDVIAAFDQSFEGKSGKHTWGKDYFWNGCTSRAEKGLELVLCAIIDVTKNTAYALAAEQTPATVKAKDIKEEKKIDVATRMDHYLTIIKKQALTILRYTKNFVFDGYFAKKKFVDGIVEMGFHVIGKLRCDADLRILYTGEQKSGPGRPKKFAGKCKIDDLEGFSFEHDVDEKTKLYSGMFYHASLEREIKVVAVRHEHNEKIGTVLLFSTDLSLAVSKIFTYYKARFQIEFIFRDAKQHTGLGDCQSRNKESLHFHFNASFTALNLVKIQEQLDTLASDQKRSFSMASHKVRYHNESLIDRFFSTLAPGVTLIKSSSIFKEVLNYGAINFM
jgi:Transposase DDE domain